MRYKTLIGSSCANLCLALTVFYLWLSDKLPVILANNPVIRSSTWLCGTCFMLVSVSFALMFSKKSGYQGFYLLCIGSGISCVLLWVMVQRPNKFILNLLSILPEARVLTATAKVLLSFVCVFAGMLAFPQLVSLQSKFKIYTYAIVLIVTVIVFSIACFMLLLSGILLFIRVMPFRP